MAIHSLPTASAAVALVVMMVSALVPAVAGHGYMLEPKSRNYLAYVAGQDYDPMSLNNGGPWASWPAGNWRFDGSAAPVCGREAYDTVPGPSQAVYHPGSIVPIQIKITAAHGGRFFFGVCPAAPAPSKACFVPLINPVDGSGSWLLSGQDGKQYGSERVYLVPMRLPPGLSCTACTLRWYWVTENSCSIGDAPGLPPCGGTAVPEEFSNCATITIQRDLPLWPSASPDPTKPGASKSAPSPSPSTSPLCVRLLRPTNAGKTYLCAPQGSAWKGGFVATPRGPKWYKSKAAWVKKGRPFTAVVNCGTVRACPKP